ncbi:hypothetical protein EYR36_005841 [Pleurotus pulmonarius]|nr:hypothetical protein EYR36_005841 [Pleurotus pulmonarius]
MSTCAPQHPPNIPHHRRVPPNCRVVPHCPASPSIADARPPTAPNVDVRPPTPPAVVAHPQLPRHQLPPPALPTNPGPPGLQPRPFKRPSIQKVKKTPKANKKTKTSADCDQENEEAEEPTAQNMTVTSRILSESGAALAPPPRRAGTGVLLPPVAPRIVSTRVRRADLGDVPQVVDKGKTRDLTNLGSSDAEDEPEDEDDEEGQGEEKKSSDEGPGDMDDNEEKEKTSSEEEEKEKTSSDAKEPSDSNSASVFHPPPSPSVQSVDAPSASVSTAGVDTASLTIAQQLATAFSDPTLLQLAIMLKVPYSMTPKASQKGEIPQIYARMKAAAQVPAKWLELKNTGKWTGRNLSINELCSLYICKTNYNTTYSKMFDNAEQFPILHALLNDPTYDQSSEEHRAVWGTRKLTKENLAAVTKELKDKEDKEKRANEKARLAKEKKSKKSR